MNINRNNYEEYFILYMDNELGNDDRHQVEDFVQKHPDLKEELELLTQYKLVPDTSIVFNKKEELLMHDDASALTSENYEEWLVLYLDNELTDEQKRTVDQFIAAHPSAKEELALLQRTQLQSETIIFPNKETLYRRTADRPVVAMRWWKVAAAVLIFAIGTTAVVLLNKKPSANNEIVIIPKVEQKAIKENPVVNNSDVEKKDEQPVLANVVHPGDAPPLKQTNSNVTVKHETVINKKQPGNLPVTKKDDPIIVDNNQQLSNNLPKPLNNSNANNAANNVIASIDITKVAKENIKPNQVTPKAVTTNTVQPSQAVYNPSDKNDELSQTGGKRSKLRGFLRKLTRTFEKTTNIDPADDENRILVGGLA
ncbi:MAG: hypothetical protein JJE22_19910, partial [Bacteroidia bacterium]|nr:hypothetical protein [Bacteroidia bacterium]